MSPAGHCSTTSSARCTRPPTEQRYERAAALRRRRKRLSVVLGRLGGRARGDPRAPAAAARRAPRRSTSSTASGSSAAGSWTGVRCRTTSAKLVRRTAAALVRDGCARRARDARPSGRDRRGPDSVRRGCSSHPDTPQLAAATGARAATRLRRSSAQRSNGSSTTIALIWSAPTVTAEPAGASRRTSASASGPSDGDWRRSRSGPRPRPSNAISSPVRGGARQPQAAQVPVRLTAVVQPRDRLLADVAPLRERHRALVQVRPPAGSRSRRDRVRSAAGRARRARIRRPPRRPRSRRRRSSACASVVRLPGVAQQVDPEVRADRAHRDARQLSADVRVLDVRQVLDAGYVGRSRAQQRQQPALRACACGARRRSRSRSGGSC